MDITKKVVREALADRTIIGDGHTIFDPNYYEPHFSQEVLDDARLCQVHRSGEGHKATIFDERGDVMETCEGVANLRFLYWVARRTGIEWTTAFGRGTEARRIVAALAKWADAEVAA